MRVLLISYGHGDDDVSESLTSYKISKEIQKFCSVRILTKDNTKSSNIININTNSLFKRSFYYRAVKPDYPEFIFKAYRYAITHKKEYDIIHHISPISLRYPNPLCNINKPFIWGPVGGSIPYPKGFETIQLREPLLQRLRKIDFVRLRWDPFMVNTMDKSNKIIVTCNAIMNKLAPGYQEKTVVIPEGIDLEIAPSESFIEKNYVFSSGRLVPYKGFELLIRAFAKSNIGANTRLLISGEGKEKGFLNQLIDDLGMHNRIKLLGKVKKQENLALMKASLFCVFPALNEAFGHVNLEAMSMKKAIIVTDNGGPADIVVNGETGYKVISDSISRYIAKLTEKMNLLYNNENLRKKMGKNGYRRIKKLYSWNEIGKKYIEIYKET